MAKVSHLSKSVIKGLRKAVDYYYWRGIPIVRKWPRKPITPVTLAQKQSQQWFKWSREDLMLWSIELKQTFRWQYIGRAQAWLDHYTGTYMNFCKKFDSRPPIITWISVLDSGDPTILEIEGVRLDGAQLVFMETWKKDNILHSLHRGILDPCYKARQSGELFIGDIEKQYNTLTTEYPISCRQWDKNLYGYIDYTCTYTRAQLWVAALANWNWGANYSGVTNLICCVDGNMRYPGDVRRSADCGTWTYHQSCTGIVYEPWWDTDDTVFFQVYFKREKINRQDLFFGVDIDGNHCKFDGTKYYIPLDKTKFLAFGKKFTTKTIPYLPGYPVTVGATGDPDWLYFSFPFSPVAPSDFTLQVGKYTGKYICEIPKKIWEASGFFAVYDGVSNVLLGPFYSKAGFGL